MRDTEPVAGIMRLTNLVVVPPSLPVKTVQEFIDYAKANPGKLSMASTGVGTSTHLSGELFKVMTKTDLVHVPYRGSSPAYPDLLTGKVHVLFGNLTGSIELVQSGRLRGLGVTSATRWSSLPDMPTIAETVPGYEADVWYGIVAPKGTPREIITALNKAINAGLADPDHARPFRAGRRCSDADEHQRVRKDDCRRDREVAEGRAIRRCVGRLEEIVSSEPRLSAHTPAGYHPSSARVLLAVAVA